MTQEMRTKIRRIERRLSSLQQHRRDLGHGVNHIGAPPALKDAISRLHRRLRTLKLKA